MEVLFYSNRWFEDVGLQDLKFDGMRNGRSAAAFGGERLVNFSQCGSQFAPDADPFSGFEIVVLEKEEQWGSLQKGDVRA